MRQGLAVVALVLAAAIMGLPWVLGSQAEAVYEDALAQLQQQGVRVLDGRYRRGWFTSDASVAIELPQSSGQTPVVVPLRLASEVAHGPWTHGSLRLLPSAALIESRLELLIPGIESLPLLLTTRVELNGGGVTRIRLPGLSQQSAALDMEMAEGAGELKFSAGFASVEGGFEIPSLSLSAPEGMRIDLQDLRTSGSGARWRAGLNTGEGSLSLGRAEVSAPDLSLLAGGLSVTGNAIPDGELLNMELVYRVEDLTVNGAVYGASQLSLFLRRLPGEALASMRQAMQEVTTGAVDESLVAVAVAAIVAEHLPRLLADDPELALERLEISTPEGVVGGRLSIASQGLTSDDLARPVGWVDRLAGEGELSIPRPLLLQLLEGWQYRQVQERLQQQGLQSPTLPQGLVKEVAMAAQEQLDSLVGQGWLAEKENTLTVALRLENALLTVNGKSIPIGTALAVP